MAQGYEAYEALRDSGVVEEGRLPHPSDMTRSTMESPKAPRDNENIHTRLEQLRAVMETSHKLAYELEDRLGAVMVPARSDKEKDESFVDDELSPLHNQTRHLISIQRALNRRLQEIVERLEL